MKKIFTTLVSVLLAVLLAWGAFSYFEIASKSPLDTNREYSKYNLIIWLMDN